MPLIKRESNWLQNRFYRLFNLVGEKSQICNSRKGEKIIVDSHRWNYFRELWVGERATKKKKKKKTLEEAEMAKGLEEINHFILAGEIVEALILRFFTAQVDDPWTHESIPTVNGINSQPENCLKTGSLLKDYRRKKNVRLHVTLNQILSFLLLCSFSVEPSPLTHQPENKTKTKTRNQLNPQPWHWNETLFAFSPHKNQMTSSHILISLFHCLHVTSVSSAVAFDARLRYGNSETWLWSWARE